MTGQEKPKRKALHRGLDDIVNRDASLTSKLLGRVKPPEREPLEATPAENSSVVAASSADKAVSPREVEGRGAVNASSPRQQSETASVHRLESTRPSNIALTREVQVRESPTRPSSGVKKAISTFDEFVERWGFILRSGAREGKLRICEVLYQNTHAKGIETFFTSYDKLAKVTQLEKKQCAINIKQLENLGFVERLNIYNTSAKQGTEFKLHLEPLPLEVRKAPRRHHYAEELPSKS